MPDEFGIPTTDEEWRELYKTDRTAWHDAYVINEQRKQMQRDAEAARRKQALQPALPAARTNPPKPLSHQDVFDVVHGYTKQHTYRVIEKVTEAVTEAVERTNARVDKIEERDALRVAARAALRDGGTRTPTDDQVERVVDEFITKGYSARRASAAPSLVIDWTKRVDVFIGDRKVATWDPSAHAGDEPTRDPDSRLSAHARHLRNLDNRIGRLEHGA